ncbi:unnamed protein product [Arabidopsis lyrata]|nr:unnamed protein product [Arabidopsis lyrata]
MAQQELNVRLSSVFFPISPQQITNHFAYPATEDEKSQQDELFKILNMSLVIISRFWFIKSEQHKVKDWGKDLMSISGKIGEAFKEERARD